MRETDRQTDRQR